MLLSILPQANVTEHATYFWRVVSCSSRASPGIVLFAGVPCAAAIPEDPYIESTGYWQDISVDQSDDDVWKTTDMGWGVYPEGMRKMLNYIQVSYCWG